MPPIPGLLEPAVDRLVVKLCPLPIHWVSATLTTFVTSLSPPGPASVQLPRPTSVYLIRPPDGLQLPFGMLLYDWPNADENIFSELVHALGRFANEQPKLPATFVPAEPIKAFLIYQTAPILLPVTPDLPALSFPLQLQFKDLLLRAPPALPPQRPPKRHQPSPGDRLHAAQAEREEIQKAIALREAAERLTKERHRPSPHQRRINTISQQNKLKRLKSQANQSDHPSDDDGDRSSSSTVKSS